MNKECVMRYGPTIKILQCCLWAVVWTVSAWDLGATGARAQVPRGIWVRVQVLQPAQLAFKVHIGVRANYGTNTHFVVGQTVSALAKGQYTAPAEAEIDTLRQQVQPM